MYNIIYNTINLIFDDYYNISYVKVDLLFYKTTTGKIRSHL